MREKVFTVNGKTSGIQLAVRRSRVPFFSQTSRRFKFVRFRQQTVLSFERKRICVPRLCHQEKAGDVHLLIESLKLHGSVGKTRRRRRKDYFFFSPFSADKLESSASSSSKYLPLSFSLAKSERQEEKEKGKRSSSSEPFSTRQLIILFRRIFSPLW